MSSSVRCCAALLSLLASPAIAQADGVMPRKGLSRALAAERAPAPHWPGAGELRGGGPARNGLIAAMDIGDGLQLGVGRFSMLDLARTRTHLEAEPRPTDVRGRQSSIAAVRLSFSF
ncbi:MAG TPA: hypothetical protein VGW40_02955 [Allosphingosinicella sp.]|nr:hypothetical protein [Allosphingosinicella sp.]